MADRWSVFDLVESFQLSHTVGTLHSLGLFRSLEQPATADEISAKTGLDAAMLRGAFEYVAARTDLLRKIGDRFVATFGYSGGSRFLLDLYLGAYGQNAAHLVHLLRDPSTAPTFVDRVRHALAFEAAESSALPLLVGIIRRLEFKHLLDLGCGTAALLLELAKEDGDFLGWGIELNRGMCRVARGRVSAARLGKRLHIVQGDGRNLSKLLSPKVRAAVSAVTACNSANEMFGKGPLPVVAWLREMRKALPGRPLLIADYYGRLGRRGGSSSRETLLHDYVQLISGQGVPPASAAEWRAIYSRAECRLVHIIEDTSTTRFIHILRL